MSNPDEASAPPRVGLYRGLRRALDRKGADRGVVIISLVLMAFCLDTGLSGDDYVHKLIARGSTEIKGFIRAPLDMYRFTTGEDTAALMREGVLEWWVDPQAKLAFFRPLSALTHYIDYTLWPEHPWLMHLHSLLWGALLLAGVLSLYRKLISPSWVCALAVFIYALDDARGWIGSWVAARNAVVATAFSVFALLYHHRARMEGYKLGAWLSPLCLGLGLLSGEGAVSICGYLFAHALVIDRGPLSKRLGSIVPHAVLALVYRVVHHALGYGVAYSGLYFDPLTDPAGFFGALTERMPILLFSQMGGSWSDGYTVLFAFPNLQRAVMWIALMFLLALGYALWPLVRRDATVRFGLLGALFSLVIASATFMADRMLTWVAIGAAIALAKLIAAYIDEREMLTQAALRALVLPPLMLWVVFEKTVMEPVFLPWRSRGNMIVRDSLDRMQAGVPVLPSIRDKRVIYLNPVAVPQAAYLQVERAGMGVPRPRSQCLLATAESEVRIERVDVQTLRVRQRGGYLLSPGSLLLRNPRRAFRKGAVVKLDGLDIEISDLTDDGRPAEILARFDRPLEDPSWLWLQWVGAGYVPFVPPAVGKHVTLPAADFIRAISSDQLQVPIDGRLPRPNDPRWPTTS